MPRHSSGASADGGSSRITVPAQPGSRSSRPIAATVPRLCPISTSGASGCTSSTAAARPAASTSPRTGLPPWPAWSTALTSHPRAASAGPIRHHVPAIEDSPWISSTRPTAGPVGAQRGSGQLS